MQAATGYPPRVRQLYGFVQACVVCGLVGDLAAGVVADGSLRSAVVGLAAGACLGGASSLARRPSRRVHNAFAGALCIAGAACGAMLWSWEGVCSGLLLCYAISAAAGAARL